MTLPADANMVLYHGDDEYVWKRRKEGSVLYLTIDLADAWIYAQEEAGRRDGAGRPFKAVVFSVPLSALPQNELEEDDGGWPTSDGTWQASLKEKGSITVPFSRSYPWKKITEEMTPG